VWPSCIVPRSVMMTNTPTWSHSDHLAGETDTCALAGARVARVTLARRLFFGSGRAFATVVFGRSGGATQKRQRRGRRACSLLRAGRHEGRARGSSVSDVRRRQRRDSRRAEGVARAQTGDLCRTRAHARHRAAGKSSSSLGFSFAIRTLAAFRPCGSRRATFDTLADAAVGGCSLVARNPCEAIASTRMREHAFDTFWGRLQTEIRTSQ